MVLQPFCCRVKVFDMLSSLLLRGVVYFQDYDGERIPFTVYAFSSLIHKTAKTTW